MFPTRNIDVIRRVQRAEFSGATLEERKPLYVEQNTLDLDLDRPIYRIFQLRYIQSDVEHQRLTLVLAHPDSWGDEYENPLLLASFPEPVTGGRIDLNGVVGDFHALSWTKSSVERKEAWEEFSHGLDSVRIETTPRKLLSGLMHCSDPWFMLRFYIGKMRYKSRHEIDAWIAGPDYSTHLDSLGQEMACSLMLLRSVFKDEEEVRLLCSPLSNSPSGWANERLKVNSGHLSAPFDWSKALDGVLYGSHVSESAKNDFRSLLSNKGIRCSEATSSMKFVLGAP